jgi:predicted dehydrogenase
MKTVSIVLSGIGGYGSGYVRELLPKIADPASGVTVAGAAEPYPDACPLAADLKAAGVPVYRTLDEFYAVSGADLAVISAPIEYHAQQILTALENGSNVLCEKPLCGDADDIPALLRARDAAGRFVDIGYQWSHSEAILSLKADILSGIFGAPFSMKTIVLWPRDEAYFRRGSGWAGTIRGKSGALVLDSVANNAAAHYLHNMFFVTGPDGASADYRGLSAKLYRANPIENFDTCVLRCKTDGGADVLFIASHAAQGSFGPVFRYVFERGEVAFAGGHITACFADGTEKDYGSPEAANMRKLWLAVDAVRAGSAAVACPIEAAATQTRIIRELYERFPIEDFDGVRIDEKRHFYVPGLFEKLKTEYENA